MPIRFPRTKNGHYMKGVDESVLVRTLKLVNDSLKKRKHSLRVTTLGDSVFAQPRIYISSGILPIDSAVCYGMGFPSGIIEIYGGEASGKTAILENTLAESQKNRYYTILFPQEFAVDYRRVKILHLKEDELIIGDAETIEDVYEQIKMLVKAIREKDKKTPIVIGWDSIAATPTRTELQAKAGLDSSDMGRSALQISKLFRRLVGFLFRNRVCLICINQTRTNLGVMFGSKETTFGGKALRFYAWVRIRLGNTKVIDVDGEDVGFMCNLKVTKNKVAPPLKTCKFPIYWERGIDAIAAIWEYAVDREIFDRKGTSYRWGKDIVTKKSFRKYYRKHKAEIDAAIRKSVKDKPDE